MNIDEMIDEAFQTILQSDNNANEIATLLREAMRTPVEPNQLREQISETQIGETQTRGEQTDAELPMRAQPRIIPHQQRIERSNTQVLDSWNRHVQEYHENMRIYNQNVAQMTRISQSLIRNNIEDRTSNNRYRTRNSARTNVVPRWVQDLFPEVRFEIQGFSFPPATSQRIQRLSTAEMYRVTETFDYTEGSIPNSNVCPITLEEFEIGEALSLIKNCRHIFKKRALFHWFTLSVDCPVCRRDVRQSLSI